MITPERNDVDLSALFRWGKQASIKTPDGIEVFSYYVRLVGDAELNRARVFALRKSAELRRLLRNSDSEERLAFIVDYDSVDEEKIIEMLVYMNMRDITLKVIDRVDVPFPKELKDNATLEEQENYQLELDAWPTKRENEIREGINKEAEKLRTALQGQSKEKLYKQYEDTTIVELCETEMIKRYKEFCTFSGLYKDEHYQERLLESFETFDNLPSEIKQQLLNSYTELEMSMDELKK